jgi:hypothetical protein
VADNIVIHDASGSNVTIRAKDPGTLILTEQSGNEANSQVDGHSQTLGTTTGAAVTSNAAGSLQQYLRGLVQLMHAEDVPHISGDFGNMLLAVRTDTAATLSSTTGDYTPLQTDSQGQLRVAPGQIVSQTSTVTRLGASLSAITLLASNTARIGACIMNDSSAVLYLKLGAAASTSSWTARLGANDANGNGGYYEVPFGYSGIITGLWSALAGACAVTELS